MLNVEQVGMMAAIFPITNIFGALVGGSMADLLNRKTSAYLVFIFSSIASILFLFADTWQILAFVYGIAGFLFGAMYATIGAISMDITNPRLAGIQFSIFMGLFNVGEIGIGNGLAGLIIDTLGYERLFLYSALFYAAGLFVLYFVNYRTQTKL